MGSSRKWLPPCNTQKPENETLKMAYEIKWLDRGAHRRFWGHVTAAEFLQAITDVQKHPDYDDFKFTVSNFLDVGSYDISRTDVMTFVAHGLGARCFNSDIVVAIVATAEPTLNLVKSLYEPLSKYQIGYWPNDGEANEWVFQKTGIHPALLGN